MFNCRPGAGAFSGDLRKVNGYVSVVRCMMPVVRFQSQGKVMGRVIRTKHLWWWLGWGLTMVMLLTVCTLATQSYLHKPQHLITSELGELHDYPAWWWQRGMVVMWSSARGWQAGDEVAAREFAHRGFRVLGVDTAAFVSAHQHDASCLYLPGLIEAVSRDQQKKSGITAYQLPALLGHGEGATLAYLTQLQAPPLALSGVVALNPTATLPINTPLCDHPALAVLSNAQTVRVEPPSTSAPLRVWVDAGADAASRQFAAVINTGVTSMAHDDASLFRGYRLALADIDAARQHSPMADLPLVEVLPEHMTTDAFAILYSGDGGWRDLDQTLAGVLANDGMPVVGVDTLNYYWHDKTPELSAQDLARVIRYYQQQWHRQHVVLIGFSFGANVLPFLYNRLPDDLKSSVVRISLLSPERSTAFSVDPSAWLHIHRDSGKLPIAPELAKLPAKRVQCVYGQDESSDSLCTLPDSAATNVVKKPGGHHFDENYEQLARDVMAEL